MCSDKVLNNYTQMIADGMLCHEEDVRNVCVSVITIDTEYFMSFIEYETDDILGIKYTFNDGTERFVVLNKAHIVGIAIVYQQDYDILYDNREEETDIMYQ